MALNTLLPQSLRGSLSYVPQTTMALRMPSELSIGKNVTFLCRGKFSVLLWFLKTMLKGRHAFCTNVNRLGLQKPWETFFYISHK
jgi:hypothetical protein